jgi:hypothetical protein
LFFVNDSSVPSLTILVIISVGCFLFNITEEMKF